MATSYDPKKSNMLSTPSDLELRGIGEGSNRVEDELDCLTGEVTERIGEVTFDGSADENWNLWATYPEESAIFRFSKVDSLKLMKDFVKKGVFKCDKFSTVLSSSLINDGVNHPHAISFFGLDSEYIQLRVYKSLLKSVDVDGLRDYLANEPITVQYQLATESIKTVDLSDNHVYSYKDVTHYDCSSAEGSLVPTLSVKVPTDVQATIAQQRETIQTLNNENKRLNQIQEALKASMLDSQVQLMNLSWDIDFEVFTLRESISLKDFLLDSRTGSNIDKFSQAKFIIENDCPDLEKLILK